MNKEAFLRYVLTAWAIIPWTQAALRTAAIARIEWAIRPQHNLYWMYAERDPVFRQIGDIQYRHTYLLFFSLLGFALFGLVSIVHPRFFKRPWYLFVYTGGWLVYLASLLLYSCCVMDY